MPAGLFSGLDADIVFDRPLEHAFTDAIPTDLVAKASGCRPTAIFREVNESESCTRSAALSLPFRHALLDICPFIAHVYIVVLVRANVVRSLRDRMTHPPVTE